MNLLCFFIFLTLVSVSSFRIGAARYPTPLRCSLENKIPVSEYVSLQAKDTVRESITAIINEIQQKNEKIVGELRLLKDENMKRESQLTEKLNRNKEEAQADAAALKTQLNDGIIKVHRLGIGALVGTLLFFLKAVGDKILEGVFRSPSPQSWWAKATNAWK